MRWLAAEAAIFCCGFFVVAGLAHGLPVAFGPEEFHVSAMWDIVIDYCGNSDALAAFVAVWALAQRVGAQEAFARDLPLVAITSLSR